jgi:hypothetical protein
MMAVNSLFHSRLYVFARFVGLMAVSVLVLLPASTSSYYHHPFLIHSPSDIINLVRTTDGPSWRAIATLSLAT